MMTNLERLRAINALYTESLRLRVALRGIAYEIASDSDHDEDNPDESLYRLLRVAEDHSRALVAKLDASREKMSENMARIHPP